MAIKQMVLTVTVEKSAINGAGKPYNYYQCIDVDLVNEDVADFLVKIGDDINEQSSFKLAIQNDDGQFVSFVDGMVAQSQGYGWEPVKRISEIDDGDYADALRRTAILFAQRRNAHFEETEEKV